MAFRQSRRFGICTLQNPKEAGEVESHSLLHPINN
jgi:hypothetical protein